MLTKMLLYCTKSKPQMYRIWNGVYELVTDCQTQSHCNFYGSLNGKVVGECDFEIEEIKKQCFANMGYYASCDFSFNLKGTCLTHNELDDYLQGKNGYAIHIKNLKIYDKPKELSELKGTSKNNFFKVIDKAPQNMMNVFNEKLENCVLISIRPEWLCKILNGEKTIEVRKKVLKEMINND